MTTVCYFCKRYFGNRDNLKYNKCHKCLVLLQCNTFLINNPYENDELDEEGYDSFDYY